MDGCEAHSARVSSAAAIGESLAATQRLRSYLGKGNALVAPGAYDALTARMTEAAGFPAVYVGGYATGAHLGCSEPLVSMTEQVAVAERIAKAVSVPVLVDAHTGFGGPAHVARTVQEFEAAGIAGIHIEDQLFPKSIGYHEGVKEVVDIETATLRFRTANEAKADKDFVVMARTDAWGARNGGLTETIRRCEAFAEAGAEMIVPLVFDIDDIVTVREAVPGPQMVWLGGTAGMNIRSTSDAQGRIRKYPELTIDDIFELGFSIVLYPSAAIMAAVLAVNEFLCSLNVNGSWAPEGVGRAREMIEETLELDDRYAFEVDFGGGNKA